MISALLAALVLVRASEAGQDAPLAIAAPANGAIVTPGQVLSISVTSPANVAFAHVGIVSPLEDSDLATSLPAQFTLTIPTDVRSGRFDLTADGRTAAGEDVTATIEIDVERGTPPTSISTLLSQLIFDAPGEALPMKVVADFATETFVDVTESSKVTYLSSDPTVATVDPNGFVRAVAPGAASITVTYADGGNITTEVPVTVPPAPFTMSPESVDFGGHIVGTPVSQQVILTNSSGRILTVLDVTTTGDFAQTNNCVSSSPLALDTTCMITVTFSPTVVGTRGGVLTIVNDNRTAGFTLVGVGQSLVGTEVRQRTPAEGMSNGTLAAPWATVPRSARRSGHRPASTP